MLCLAYNPGYSLPPQAQTTRSLTQVEDMAIRTLGIILNGATGGICSFQHLENALGPIRAEGGLKIGDQTIMPKLLLVGRNEGRF